MTGRDRDAPAFRQWKNSTQVDNLHFFYSIKGLPLELIADLLNMSKSRVENKARKMKFRRPFLYTEPPAPEEKPTQ